VVVYFFLAYVIAWSGSFAAIGGKFLRGEAMNFIDLILMLLPLLAGPSISGITMTAITDGKKWAEGSLLKDG